jgi:hypothetical protein
MRKVNCILKKKDLLYYTLKANTFTVFFHIKPNVRLKDMDNRKTNKMRFISVAKQLLYTVLFQIKYH